MINYKKDQTLAKKYYELFLDYTNAPYVRESIAIIIASALLFGGYTAFSWHKKRQNSQAFAGLVEVSRAYEKALQATGEALQQSENPWEDTQLMLEALSTANSGSSLSPFFIFYQAELALQQENDYETACTLMAQGLKKLPKKSVYYDMFHLKQIKMLLDSPQEHVAAHALKDLQLMAENSENYYYQEALHTLAMYQAAHGNMDGAVQAWKLLADSQPTKALIESPYVTHAQEKLKSLNIMLEARN